MRNTQFSLLSKILLSALPLLLVAAFAHEASAQELHAQIRGTVVYQSGAIVENADVAATNLETARTASVLSGPDGTFQFLKLAVGVYDPSTWRVNQNLTLNFGAGYQIDTPLVNQHYGSESVNCFRPGQQSTVFPTAPLGLVFPGDQSCSASGYSDHYDHIGPRVGFAYAPGSSADKNSNRGDSSYDARRRFVVSYDYELPRVNRFRRNGIVQDVINGWHVAGITTLQSGFPILIADTGFRSLTCDSYTFYGCPDAPNQVAPVSVSDPRTSEFVNTTRKPSNTTALPSYWFNPNSFALEAIGTIGNAGRNNFAGPGMNNTDLSLSKRVYFGTENQRRFLELRLEAFNAFNHTQFSMVSSTDGGSGVSGDINSSKFGRILSASPGRTIQIGAKLNF